MDIEQFQAQHPALYQQVFSSGRNAGVLAERDRIEALLVYAPFDPKLEKIQACISEGRDFSKKELAEFRVASFNNQALSNLESDSAEAKAACNPSVGGVGSGPCDLSGPSVGSGPCDLSGPSVGIGPCEGSGLPGLSADAGQIQNKWLDRQNQANKHRGGEQ